MGAGELVAVDEDVRCPFAAGGWGCGDVSLYSIQLWWRGRVLK